MRQGDLEVPQHRRCWDGEELPEWCGASTQQLWVGCERPHALSLGRIGLGAQHKVLSLPQSRGCRGSTAQDPRKPGPEPGLVPMGPPVSRWCCRPGSEVL